MVELVRVKDKYTGHHYTIPRSALQDDRHSLVTSKTDPAVDRNGDPTPPKFNIGPMDSHRADEKPARATTKAAKAATEANKEAN